MASLKGELLKDALKQKAYQLGFTLAGVTTADPPESFPQFEQWINHGRHAGMEYLAADRSLTRRADPRAIFPECKSILVLGIPYSHPGEKSGGIAAYAWGEDYHEVLKVRLQEIVSFLEDQTGVPVLNRWYIDTGPILERDLARRAGLGWIGKNSMLIHPKKGSTFLLSEILLGIELPPDDPFKSDHCGSCTRCLDSCPTGCILGDRTLDAGRCLSYLTIENKGEIPIDLREFVGEWLFGCDICQQVCPWNRFAPEEGDARFISSLGMPFGNPVDDFPLSPQEFNNKFKGSPVKRAKRRGYLRNIAVVLGNRQNQDDVESLSAGLQDFEPLVRQHAAWALGQIGRDAARNALIAALNGEMESDVIAEIKSALEHVE